MSQERDGFFLGGQRGGVKFALEEKGNLPPVYNFLEDLGITTGIVKLADIQTNGHTVSATWIGTGIDVKDLNRKSIAKAGGTGGLEIVVDNGEKRTEIFFNGGRVVGITKEPMSISPKQGRMNI